ncbi:hypothetical protein C8A00DRAFT_37808 [Chaetomidium leptoderma]|uniref:Uncharacterized protein n=1 Tax=Chaetomidium leptoderma TaxID=669021 RepID=A0AAN6VG83_9PEZI|nr:hypothetical protein C8A00DRAFT_37808 [Chaetomidium leptoderma]
MAELTERNRLAAFALLRQKQARLNAIFHRSLALQGLPDLDIIRARLQQWLDHSDEQQQQQQRQQQGKDSNTNTNADTNTTNYYYQGGGGGFSACSFEMSDRELRSRVIGALDAVERRVCLGRLGWLLGEVARRSAAARGVGEGVENKMIESGREGKGEEEEEEGGVGDGGESEEEVEEEEEEEEGDGRFSQSSFSSWWSREARSGARTPDTELWCSEFEDDGGDDMGTRRVDSEAVPEEDDDDARSIYSQA